MAASVDFGFDGFSSKEAIVESLLRTTIPYSFASFLSFISKRPIDAFCEFALAFFMKTFKSKSNILSPATTRVSVFIFLFSIVKSISPIEPLLSSSALMPSSVINIFFALLY